MNNQRRKCLQNIVDALETQKQEIESLTEEEQEAFDNMPEGIQYSKRGETMGENISELEDAASNLDDVINQILEIIEK